MKGAKKGGHR